MSSCCEKDKSIIMLRIKTKHNDFIHNYDVITLSSPVWTIAMRSTWGYPWKETRNFSLYKILGVQRMADVTPLLCEPVCFWGQFKVLVMNFKVLYGNGIKLLWDHLRPITSASLSWSSRKANQSIYSHWQGPGRDPASGLLLPPPFRIFSSHQRGPPKAGPNSWPFKNI